MRLLLAIVVQFTPSAMAHQGHTSSAAWEACDAAALGDDCTYVTDEHALHRGTCRSMSGDLICVRNRPVEPEVPQAGGAPSWLGGAPLLVLGLGGAFGVRRWWRAGNKHPSTATS